MELTERVSPDWADSLEPVSEQLALVDRFLEEERATGATVLPESGRILAALQRPLADVRVLIVGQDPYPTPGHSIGIAFATSRELRPDRKSVV